MCRSQHIGERALQRKRWRIGGLLRRSRLRSAGLGTLLACTMPARVECDLTHAWGVSGRNVDANARNLPSFAILLARSLYAIAIVRSRRRLIALT